MSRTIDEKVVEMRFDNSDFERNVTQSMSTLDKLKGALNFSGMEKAFSGITSAADKVNLSGLGGAIEGVGEKFSVLETIATGALMKIGSGIETWLVDKLKAVSIDQVTEGFKKYGDKTTSVQTIMNATGRSIDEVSEKLDALNWFTDETSYNFTDMTSNIGKFTSQGVELEDAVVAMQGISTAAALAGQNAGAASRVMYNFSQSLGQGAVKLQDWMSVENANMATEEFKQTIIDTAIELGKLDQYGNILENKSSNYQGDAFVNIGNFRSTLASGWFDDEVLVASMKKFGGFSVRLNEVYDQFNENYDVTTSQILSWLDDYEAGTLDIEAAVKKTGLSAEEILPVLEELSSDEYELGRRAFAAAQEAKTFGDVMDATADAVSTAWMNVFENIFGNYEEAKVTWTQLSNELWDIFAGPVSNLNDLLTDWHDMGGRDDFIQSVKNMYHAVRSILDPIGEAWTNLFPETTAEDIFNITQRFKDFTEGLVRNEDQMDRIRESFENIFSFVKMITDGIGSLARAFLDPLREISSFHVNLNGVESVKTTFGGIGAIFDSISDKLRGFVDTIKRIREVFNYKEKGGLLAPNVIPDLERQHGVLITLLNVYDKISESLSVMGRYAGYAYRLGDAFAQYEEAGGGLIGIFGVLAHYIKLALVAWGDLVEVWTGVDLDGPIFKVIDVINNFIEALKRLKSEAAFSELKDKFFSIFSTFESEFGTIGSWFTPIREAIGSVINSFSEGFGKILGEDGSIYSSLKNVHILIKGWIDDTNEFIRTNETLSSVVNGIKNTFQVIADFISEAFSLSDIVDHFKEYGGGLSGILEVVRYEIRNVMNLIVGMIESMTGLDLSWLSNMISNALIAVNRLIMGAITAGKKIGDVFDAFKERFGSIGEWFKPLQKAFESISKDFSFGLAELMLGSDKKEGFSFLSDWVDSITDFVSNSKLLGTIVDIFKGLIEVVSEFISKFLSLKDTIEAFNNGGGGFSGFLEVVKEKAQNVLDLILDIIETVTGFDLGWLSGAFETAFGTVKTVVGKAVTAVKDFFGLFKKEQTEDFDKFGEATEKKFTPIKTFFEGVKKLFEGIWSVIQKLKPIFDAIFGKIGEVLGVIGSSLSNAFQNVSLDSTMDFLGKGVKIGIGVWIIKLIDSIRKPIKEVGGIFDSVKDILDGVKDALEAWQKDLQAKTLLKLAAAIGIIALAVIALSGIDTEKLWSSIGAVAALFAELMGAMAIGNKIGGDAKSMKAMASTMLTMSISLLVAASSLKKIGEMDFEQILNGVMGMGLALAELVIALKALPKDGAKGGFTMIELSLAMVIVASALKKIGEMEWGEIARGLVGMGGALAELSIALIAINKFGGGLKGGFAMIEISLAMLMVASVLKKIGDMEWGEIARGLVGMGGALAELSIALIAINKFGGGLKGGFAMIEISLAMLMVASALKKIGEMEWGEIARGLVGMGGALAELSIAIIAINQLGGGAKGGFTMILVAGAITILASALNKFGDMEWEAIARGLVAMGGALTEVILAVMIMPAGQAMLTALGLGAMAAALLLLYVPLQLFGSMSLAEIGKSLLIVAGALVVVGGLGALLGLVGPVLLLAAAGMGAMAAALLILAPALMMLGSMSLAEIGKSLLVLVGVFAVMGVAGLVLAPLVPVIVLLAAAITLLGVSVLGIGAGIALLAGGLELLGSVGTKGLTVFTAVIMQVLTFIPIFITMIGKGIIAVIKLIGDNAPIIAEAVVNVISAILDAAQVLIPKLVETVLTIVDEILKSIAEHGPSIVESVATIALDMLHAVAEYLPDFIQAGIDIVLSLIEGLADGLDNNTERAKEAFEKLFDSVLKSILTFLGVDKDKAEKFVEIAHNMITGLVSGISTFATEILTEVGNLMSKIVNKIKDKIPDIKEKGKEIGEGLKNGISNAKDKVVSVAKTVGNAVLNTFDKVFDAHSPSKETEEDGNNVIDGLVDSMDRGGGRAAASAGTVADGILGTLEDKLNYNSVFDKLGGNFEDLFAKYIEKNGTNGSFEDTLTSFLGEQGFDSYEISGLLAKNGVEGFTTTYSDQMEAYAPEAYDVNAYVAQSGAEGFTNTYSEQMESYVPEAYATSVTMGEAVPYGYADGVVSATDEVKPVVQSAAEELADATTAPIENRLAETLSYAEWVAKQYPEGLTKELSAPVFNFDDLYENMKGGELEAILNMFDAMDETGRRNLIRAYGLGEEGGNADLANYLQWYWNNEPTRMQNLESIKQATEGYQAYLDEQKALQEAQAVQSQKNYEGVQQIAADMQTQTDEANARHLAYLAEIKMDVAALREELSGVHADIAELNNMDVYIDSSALVGATAEKYNEELGNMAKIGRRRVTR